MKFDPKKAILDFDNEPIKTADGTMTYGFVIEKSLGVSKSQSGDDQYKRYRIGMAVHAAKELVELELGDDAIITKAVEEAGWSPYVYGRIVDMLKSATAVA